jgi:ADP-L-glycero-D-manno-heptose 6-epimerase
MSKTKGGIWIVTGGAGFIGSCFVRRLNDEGISDIIVIDDLSNPDDIRRRNLEGKSYLELLPKGELLERIRAGRFGKEVCAIVHMGACSDTTERDEKYLLENNYEYSRALAEWSLDHDVRFVYASSASTYGDGSLGYDDDPKLIPSLKPLNLYGRSKQLFDLWALKSGALDKICGFKFFNVYGPNEYHKGHMASVAMKAFGQVKREGKISLFKSYREGVADGDQQRDFIYVKDCVDCMWWATTGAISGLFNLGYGKARSWNDVARAIFAAMNIPSNIEYFEMPDNLRSHYQYFTEARLDNLRRVGWTKPFTSLEDGVADYIQEYLAKNERIF